MPNLKSLGSMCGRSSVPIGTPISPGTTKTSARFQSIFRQIKCSVCVCDTTEQMIANEAATVGGIA